METNTMSFWQKRGRRSKEFFGDFCWIEWKDVAHFLTIFIIIVMRYYAQTEPRAR